MEYYRKIPFDTNKETIMNAKHKTGRNIWDVIFSLDSSCFPTYRNYPQEPRGSNNPINSLITQEVCQETVEYVKNNITDPNDLYTLDFELNYAIRKLADFVLYADLDEVAPWEDDMFPPIEEMRSVLESCYKWSEDIFCCSDLFLEMSGLIFEREEVRKGNYDYTHLNDIVEAAQLQQAVQYVIEHLGF